MSLLRKFMLLVGLVATAVVIDSAAVAWSMRQLRTELTDPFATVNEVLGGLNRLRRDVWRETTLIRDDSLIPDAQTSEAPGADQPSISELRERVLRRVEDFTRHDTFLLRSGVATTRLLRTRLAESQDDVLEWIESPDATSADHAVASLLVVHELVERIEAKLIDDTQLAVGFGQDLGRAVVGVAAAAVILVALCFVLSVVLFRRWFLVPVAELRTATDRIAAGDFTHRIRRLGSDEMGRLASEVNDMAGLVERSQLERVERERLAAMGEMTRRIVHNLRNPLAGIRSLAELSRAEAPPESTLRESQGRIIDAVDRFEQWLRGLLEATRPLELNPRPTDVGALLARVAEAHRDAADAAGVTLECRADPALHARRLDPEHIEQAVSALIANAIDASPPGGAVRIAADAGTNGSWAISVHDSGPGVPPEDLERLFQPWFTTKPGGTGIGLAMVRRIATEHGGEVSVEPANEAAGARFVIRLPK